MMKNWRTFLCSSIAIIILCNFTRIENAQGSDIKQVTCSGQVLDDQDQPIAGAKVSLHEMVYDEDSFTYNPKTLGQVQTGPDGSFSFKETVKNNQYRYGYIVAEKESLALGFDNWSIQDGNKELQIKLGQPKELAGIVIDENDVPVSDAQVLILILGLGEGRERKSLSGLVAPELLTTNTDAAGKFTFTQIPATARAELIVSKPGRATLNTYKHTSEPYQKLNFRAGQKDIRIILPVEAKIEGKAIEKSTGKPVGGVNISCTNQQETGYFRPKPFVSKEDGTFDINSLSATRYVLKLVQPSQKLPDWVADPVEVITEAGKSKSNIKIELSKGGVLDVKITDAVNKEPVENVRVSVNSQTSNRPVYGRSDKNGIAHMRLIPGNYQVTYLYKQDYSQQRLQDAVMIENGETKHLEYELVGLPRIAGIVYDSQGKPLEGAELKICPAGSLEEAVSNSNGKYEVTFDLGRWPSAQTPVMFLVGRYPERNLAAAVEIEEDTRKLDIKLEPAITLFGKIVGPDGKGIPEVEVRTMMHAQRWGSTIGRKPAITDKGGNYKIKAVPPDHPYHVYARAEGYGDSSGDQIEAGNAVDHRLDMGNLELLEANLSVSGIVVDDNGKPVPGTRIFCSGDYQPHRDLLTDAEGKFKLEKICAGRIRIIADKNGTARLYGSTETEGGATDVRIILSESPPSIRYEPQRPPSLVGRPLPELKEVGIDLSLDGFKSKMLLVCFFDIEQRPSRHCLTQLSKQVKELNNEDVTVIAVHASKMERQELNRWVKKYNISFPVGIIPGDAEKIRFNWGVKSLPWLILTDNNLIVRAQGFSLTELDKKLPTN